MTSSDGTRRAGPPAPMAERAAGQAGESIRVVLVDDHHLVRDGLSLILAPMIAERLGISTHTVHRHVANLSAKLDARGLPALIRYAIEGGLVRQSE